MLEEWRNQEQANSNANESDLRSIGFLSITLGFEEEGLALKYQKEWEDHFHMVLRNRVPISTAGG